MASIKVNRMVSKNAVYIKSQRKIFVIGFNKCGTRSLANVFDRSGIGCVHWDNNNLVNYIIKDIRETGLINLDSYYPGSNAFTDIIYCNKNNTKDDIQIIEIFEFIEKLIESYPDAYYIVNTRNVEDWLISRLNHERGNFAYIYKCFLSNKYSIEYSDKMLVEYWRYIWHRHHYKLLNKFKNSSHIKYLFFDIDKTEYKDLVIFLEEDYQLLGERLPVAGRTSYDNNYLRLMIIKTLRKIKYFLKAYTK